MKNAIVTGATGFVGRWLVRELIRAGIRTAAIVRPGSGRIGTLPESELLEIVACPMEEYAHLSERMEKREECVFFHLAWEGVYGPGRADLEVQQKCVKASAAAVRAAAGSGCVRFLGLGSIMEAESLAAADADGTRPGPGYIYGEAKHMAHLVTKVLAAELGIDHLWPMLTNAYGELDDSTRFINATLRKIINGEPLEFTSGTQIYDFIHVQDAAGALIAVADRGIPFHSYRIGSGKPAPLRSFIETIGRTLAPDRTLHFGEVPYTGAQLPKEEFMTSSLSGEVGFEPKIGFEEGIRRTMAWLQGTGEKEWTR